MTGLPSKYAKMGFKRGWAAYNRKRRRKKSKSRRVIRHMARRRKFSFKRAYRSAKSGITFGNVTKVLLGAALVAVYEVYVSPMIPIDNSIKNIVELGLGIFLAASPRMPMAVKAFGTALAIVNAYALVMAYMPQGGSGQSNMPSY